MGAHLRPPWTFRPPGDLEAELMKAIDEDGPNRNAWIIDALNRKLKARKRKRTSGK